MDSENEEFEIDESDEEEQLMAENEKSHLDFENERLDEQETCGDTGIPYKNIHGQLVAISLFFSHLSAATGGL